MSISKRIQSARWHSHLTQENLGEMVGVSQRTVSRWEQGTIRPREGFLIRIAKVCGVDPSWLKTGEGEMTEFLSLTTEEKALVIEFRKIRDARDRYFVRARIHFLDQDFKDLRNFDEAIERFRSLYPGKKYFYDLPRLDWLLRQKLQAEIEGRQKDQAELWKKEESQTIKISGGALPGGKKPLFLIEASLKIHQNNIDLIIGLDPEFIDYLLENGDPELRDSIMKLLG